MSDFSVAFNFTIPPGAGQTVVTEFDTLLGNCDVTEILITFPPGCAGLVGVAVFAGGSPAYPNQAGQFFTFDDYTYLQEVSNQLNSGQWSLMGYNLDINPHTIQVVYKCNNLVISPTVPVSAPLSL